MSARRFRQWWLLLFVLALTATSLASAQSPNPARPAAGRDTVVIVMSQEPRSLNPLTTARGASLTVLATLFTQDVQRDKAWKPFAQGVESLPNVKDGTWKVNAERMTLAWKIRPRRWHDGRPVTCADYVFAHTVARNEQILFTDRVRSLARRIANVACPMGSGGTEIQVNWKERYAHANLTITETGPLPRQLLESLYRTSPSLLLEDTLGSDPKTFVGDGPYRLAEWRKGESLTVESVGPHPIFGTPKIKRIIWRFIPDTNALVTAMLSGAIDAISTIGITFDQAMELERRAASRVQVFFEPGLIWEHIDFNLDNSVLRDVRVRRAIAHAINRTQIVQQLFGGKQPVSHTYLPPKHPGYTDNVQRYPYDPARARTLLQQAGFSPGPDGIMRNAAGQRLSLEFNTTAGDRVREQVQLIIHQQLLQIGIETTILNFSRRILFEELNSRRKFTAMSMYAWVWDPESDCDGIYTSDGIPSEQNTWFGLNFSGYKNPEMDRVCKAASREIDETMRIALLNVSARILARDLPALPLYYRASLAAAKTGLQNFMALQLGSTYETWNIHTWSWR